MSYKPKFCCECGEKIERLCWKPWTSRRFCQLCATEHGAGEKLQIGLVVVAVLFGLFGLGGFWQRSGKTSNNASNLVSAVSPNKNKIEANRASENSSVQPSGQTQTTNSATETQAKTQVSTPQTLKTREKLAEQNPARNEIVYFCGAQTKKGTACSRRVKNGGRCWQHEGQAAMLPQEKLIIVNN